MSIPTRFKALLSLPNFIPLSLIFSSAHSQRRFIKTYFRILHQLSVSSAQDEYYEAQR